MLGQATSAIWTRSGNYQESPQSRGFGIDDREHAISLLPAPLGPECPMSPHAMLCAERCEQSYEIDEMTYSNYLLISGKAETASWPDSNTCIRFW